MLDRDEIGLRGHHLVDVLVRPRILVDQRLGILFHALSAITSMRLSVSSSRRASPRDMLRPGAMRARLERGCVPTPGDDERRRTHRTGDHARSPTRARIAPLRVSHTFWPMWCSRSVKLWWQLMTSGVSTSRPRNDSTSASTQAHHGMARAHRILLGPQHVGDVLGELRGAFDEIGEVRVGQVDEVRLHECLGTVDVDVGENVPDAARTGMQDDPHRVGLIEAHLDEVVAGTERTELVSGLLDELVGPPLLAFRRRQVRDRRRSVVTLPDARRVPPD